MQRVDEDDAQIAQNGPECFISKLFNNSQRHMLHAVLVIAV
jgi:hypothetical protein